MKIPLPSAKGGSVISEGLMRSSVVTVVIPCFGQAGFVGDAIRSLTRQTYPLWRCAVIYDPSEVGDAHIAEAQHDSRFVLVPHPLVGASRARNLGLSRLDGDYVVALDGDDMLASTFFSRAVEQLEVQPDVKVVYSRAWLFGEEQGELVLPEFSVEALRQRNVIYTPAMWRRSDFQRIGGYDENMTQGLEDWDVWISLLKSGGTVVCLPTVEYFYRRHPNSFSATMSLGDWYDAHQYLRTKHEDFLRRPQSPHTGSSEVHGRANRT